MPWFPALRSSHPFQTIKECYSIWIRNAENSDALAYVGDVLERTVLGLDAEKFLSVDEDGNFAIRLVTRYVDNGRFVLDEYETISLHADEITTRVSPMYIALSISQLRQANLTGAIEKRGRTKYFILLGNPLACVRTIGIGHPGAAWPPRA